MKKPFSAPTKPDQGESMKLCPCTEDQACALCAGLSDPETVAVAAAARYCPNAGAILSNSARTADEPFKVSGLANDSPTTCRGQRNHECGYAPS